MILPLQIQAQAILLNADISKRRLIGKFINDNIVEKTYYTVDRSPIVTVLDHDKDSVIVVMRDEGHKTESTVLSCKNCGRVVIQGDLKAHLLKYHTAVFD